MISNEALIIIPLWICVAVALALLVLSARAALIQRREGLLPSLTRLYVAAASFALITSAVVWATRPVSAPVATTATNLDPAFAPARAELAAKTKHLEELRASQRDVEHEIADLAAKLPENARGAELAPFDPAAVRSARLLGVILLVFALLLFAVPAVVLLGDPRTLLLRRRPPPPAAEPVGVDALALAAIEGRHADGIEAADKTREGELDTLDLLDFLFARAFCAVKLATADGAKDSAAQLASAVKDLAKLIELAPNMGEAHYLLGTARGLLGELEPALASFERAEALLAGTDLPFAHNQSVCLLGLAEKRLAEGDGPEAARLFDRVARLGVLAAQIPLTSITHGLIQIRSHVKAGKLDAARDEIARVRGFEDLGAEQQKAVTLTCDVYDLLVLFHRGQHPETLAATTSFLARWMPPGLPEPDEHTADEYLFPAVDRDKLPMAPELFRGFFFLEAVTRMAIVARKGSLPRDVEVTELAKPLLRALQFQPRHREVLAALGALYYWCKPDAREKALEWLEAAAAMGVKSEIVRRWLEQDRRRELERHDLLDAFRGTAARFLTDSMVSPRVREALLEELGRFQEFRPLLVDLEQGGAVGQQSPTIAALRERALYLQDAAGQVTAVRTGAEGQRLMAAQAEYGMLVEQLDQASTRLSDLDRRVMEDIGKTVLR
jgi:tetratricopeptide (TPR) repeat protein